MQYYCGRCGGWLFEDGDEKICIVCSRHYPAKLKDKPRLLSKIEEEIQRARLLGLRR